MDPFSSYPDLLPAPGAGSRSGPDSPADGLRTYRRDPARFAVRGSVPAALQDHVELRIEEGEISVVEAPTAGGTLPAAPSAEASPPRVVPVYVLGGGGVPFVPTGRVSVRFREGVDARSRDSVLRGLGYRIVDVPAYAPNFAWLESATGDDAAALSGLGRVAALSEVEHVEPQMVTPRGMR